MYKAADDPAAGEYVALEDSSSEPMQKRSKNGMEPFFGKYLRLSTQSTHSQGLNCNFLYKGTLAAIDSGVKSIVMDRCVVSLKYGTEIGKF